MPQSSDNGQLNRPVTNDAIAALLNLLSRHGYGGMLKLPPLVTAPTVLQV